MNGRVTVGCAAALLCAVAATPAHAATHCVSQSGSGCYRTISAAVAAASPGDTIKVGPGTYYEEVTITKPLAVVGHGWWATTVEASHKRNGFAINNTRRVSISGFTVQNALASGIWMTGSSFLTISHNRVRSNDKSLTPSATCPALAGTPFESGEAEDCGEGIFLSGISYSVISNNTIIGNAGGVLVTDDTGATHHNVVAGNTVAYNVPDCGITLPSHSGAGVFYNTVSGNVSTHNGAAGVGIFAPGPGSKAYGNVVTNNRLTNNGLPGVAMHNHAAPGVGGVPPTAPKPQFDNNVIVGNRISGNAADGFDAATPGPTGINIYSVAPMSGTMISQNVITNEKISVAVKIPALGTFPAVQAQLNDFAPKEIGVWNGGTATILATQNWWGCPAGPGGAGCATVQGPNVWFDPWLTAPF